MFDSYLSESIIARAVKSKKIKIKVYNLRDFSVNKHKQIDDRPYGGGPGMIFKPEPLIKLINKITKNKSKVGVFILSPGGKQFDNKQARKISEKYSDIILVAGRYEGIDARVKQIFKAQEISIGPYVLTGGELPALIVLDVITRQIPGVLGKYESLEDNRPAGSKIYTRPEVIVYNNKKYRVPKILLSGNHQKINNWKIKNDSNKVDI